MTWFKSDDGFWRHRKVRKLGRERTTVPTVVACAGLWQLAGNWAADNIDHNAADGFVPWDIIEGTFGDAKRRLSRRLIDVGLWELAEIDGEPGILFHDWADYNPTKAERDAEREVWRQKKERQRKGKSSGVSPGDTPETSTGTDEWTPPENPPENMEGLPEDSRIPTRPDPKEEPLRGSSAPKRKPAIWLPDDWRPSENHRTYAAEHHLDLDREVFKFRHHADANDRRQASWNGAFSTWLANAVDFRPQPPAPGRHDPATGRAVDW